MTEHKKLATEFVSIVVCTYNRKDMLRECLKSINAQDWPKSDFETIIVDGGSTDGTEELCKKEFPEAKFFTESKHGLAHARNKGAEIAHGSIVAYTDDDCVVDKGWLKNLVSGFRVSAFIIGVGGPVYPVNPEMIPEKFLVKAALGLFDDGERLKIANRGIITSNCAFKIEAFRVAKFDEQLGATRRKGLLIGGEDTDFCRTLVSFGYKLLYTPQAKVYHQVPTDRVRASYLLKRAMHNAVSYQRSILKWNCANSRIARVKALRYVMGQTIQNLFSFLRNGSFSTCYNLITSTTALLLCVTFFDRLTLY